MKCIVCGRNTRVTAGTRYHLDERGHSIPLTHKALVNLPGQPGACECHHETGSHDACCGHEEGRNPDCPVHGDGTRS